MQLNFGEYGISCERQDIDYDHHSRCEKLTVRRIFNELVLQTHEKCSFNSNTLSIYNLLKLSQGPNYFTKLISEKSQWTDFQMYARIIKHIFFPSAMSSSCPIYLSDFLLHTGTVYTKTLTEVGECIFKKLKKRLHVSTV